VFDIRYWLLTSTTYGTWLPGDDRGFVSTVRDTRPEDHAPAPPSGRVRHNRFGTEYDRAVKGLRESARHLMKGPPVWLTSEQAGAVVEQFRATCDYRTWRLLGVSVMSNHFHAVVAADGSVAGCKILGDLKSYASRRLNRQCGGRPGHRWWTESGSRRALPGERAVSGALEYLRTQHGCLASWFADQPA